MKTADEFNPPAGIAQTLSAGLRRIVAPNPSPMTFRGTNTYLLGDRDVAVIDPGPLNDAHLEAILNALKPGQKVVMDNATFHKGGRIESLIQSAGCEVWYLPPYSPDLNKIEHCWSWLKSRIRKKIKDFDTLRDAMECVLQDAS